MLLLILFPQNGRSPTLRAYNSGAKLQIKIERTKKKGEKLTSCSLDIVNYNNNYFRRPLSRRDFNKL